MTGPEKEDFRALRDEMREGFSTLNGKLDRAIDRIDSLEATRDRQEGAAKERDDGRRAFVWKVGLIVGLVSVIAGPIANALLARLIPS